MSDRVWPDAWDGTGLVARPPLTGRRRTGKSYRPLRGSVSRMKYDPTATIGKAGPTRNLAGGSGPLPTGQRRIRVITPPIQPTVDK